MDEKVLVCFIDGSGTESATALTFVCQSLGGISRWNVLKESTAESDHYPKQLIYRNRKLYRPG